MNGHFISTSRVDVYWLIGGPTQTPTALSILFHFQWKKKRKETMNHLDGVSRIPEGFQTLKPGTPLRKTNYIGKTVYHTRARFVSISDR